jgi:hypothetical protein
VHIAQKNIPALISLAHDPPSRETGQLRRDKHGKMRPEIPVAACVASAKDSIRSLWSS